MRGRQAELLPGLTTPALPDVSLDLAYTEGMKTNQFVIPRDTIRAKLMHDQMQTDAVPMFTDDITTRRMVRPTTDLNVTVFKRKPTAPLQRVRSVLVVCGALAFGALVAGLIALATL